ncbi:membrane protein YqhR [Anoxybacillus vitaminiphilus]|uniref:Membrane protein YqhR n=1 Tax=Paranoxybacillus vitaminiphilus TaxID=581036 RepID=A0A327YPY5_9BACL|nr:YqhR family membrane protein [Anoxybacillus vitaminiphilus]RAK22346.1 membrane protein YqhR [Anoxybacillus vitaminiphilus]
MDDEQSKNRQLEQNQKEKPMSLIMKVVVTGFFGGVFWSLLGYFAYTFHFTELSPNMILLSWAAGDWKYGRLGNFLAIFLIGILSILAAFVYYAFFRKMEGIWTGLVYGLALWGIIFFVLNPLFPNLQPIAELNRDTIITTVCLYILYGVFIGYSISFESSEHERQKQLAATNE